VGKTSTHDETMKKSGKEGVSGAYKVPRHKDVWESGGIAPFILYLGNKLR
jgi:hypothetical protein